MKTYLSIFTIIIHIKIQPIPHKNQNPIGEDVIGFIIIYAIIPQRPPQNKDKIALSVDFIFSPSSSA